MGGSGDLEQLARARFVLLSESEIKMLQAAASGTTALCGPSAQDDDLGNEPADSDKWSEDRQVRSDLIRWLCIDQAARDCVDPRGIQLYGAKIVGALDLSFATVLFPLRLSRCCLSDDWNLNSIEIPSIWLTGTWVHSLTADVAKVRGSVVLKEGFCAKGKVQLRGAQIGGNLDCRGGKFQNAADAGNPDSGKALDAEGAKVEQSVFLNNNFEAEGEVSLFNADVGGDLDCGDSKFQNPAKLNPDNAQIPGCGKALNAEGVKVGGAVFVRCNFEAKGEVSLFNAEIRGDLDCGGGKFLNPANAKIPGSGKALNAEGAKVEGSIFLRNNFKADGAVRLFGAEIGRGLYCGDGKFQNPARAGMAGSGVALDAEMARVGGAVFLNDNFSPDGEVRLLNAQIGGDLDCGGSKFQNPAIAKIPGSGMAFNAQGAKVGGSFLVRNNFSAEGEVRLFKADVGGNLDCRGSKFLNSAKAEIPGSGMALNAESAKVGGSVFVRHSFSAEGEVTPFNAEGEVSLFNAEIGGDLDCGGGKFLNPAKLNPANAKITGSGMALNAVGAKVGGSVFLRSNFLAEGAVRLFGAEIGRSLDCGNGKFQNPAKKGIQGTGVALDAEIAKVSGPVSLNSNLLAEGEVRLLNAQIGGDLDCSKSKFHNAADAESPDSGVALNAKGINIEGSMLLSDEFSAVGTVKLSNARIARSLSSNKAAFESLDLIDAFAGSFVDDENSWPKPGKLSLDGFVYGRISGGPRDANKRLEWLQRQPSFARQPYRQLATILGNIGDDLGARQVLSKMQQTAWEQRRWPVRLISPVLRRTIGYGYFPLRAVWLLLALVLIGSALYWVADKMGSIVPIQKESYASFEAHCYPTNEYERFHTIPYSLENSFPLVKLGVQDRWAPAPETRVPACWSNGWTCPSLQLISSPGFLRWFRWIQICLGWVLTTLFVAGVTGILRKN